MISVELVISTSNKLINAWNVRYHSVKNAALIQSFNVKLASMDIQRISLQNYALFQLYALSVNILMELNVPVQKDSFIQH